MNLLSITKITGIAGVPDPEVPGLFSEIIVGLPKREIRLRCDAETDEIVHSGGVKKKRAGTVPIVTGTKRVEAMWAMTSRDGFFEGLRLALVSKGVGSVLEFVTLDSAIEVIECRAFSPKRAAKPGR